MDYVEKGCNYSDVICSDEFEDYDEVPDPRLRWDGHCEYVLEFVLGNHIYTYDDLFLNQTAPYQLYYGKSFHFQYSISFSCYSN